MMIPEGRPLTEAPIKVMRWFGCALILLTVLQQTLLAQTDSSGVPQLGLVISSSVDTARSDTGALSRLFGEGRGEGIVNSLNQRCRTRIAYLLDDQDIQIPVVLSDSDLEAHGQVTRWVYLINMLSVDQWGKYTSRSQLLFTDRLQPLLALKQELRAVSAADAAGVVDSLAESVSQEVSRMVTEWLVESLYKIRVVVNDFESSDLDTIHAFLRRGLRSMVETELASNEAFLVYSARDSLSGNTISRAYANYRIKGSYFCFQKSIRVDIHCLKTRSGRILLSRSITLDTLSLSKLSGHLALAMNRLKKAMLADDRRGSRTLAVVADPPTRYFQAQAVSEDATDIARLFRRNVANRLRWFVHLHEQPAERRRLDIYDDTDALDRYLESYHDPGEIISDLGIDYLILLKIEDLGQRLRVAATMHSYSSDSLIFGELIFSDDDSKARFRNLIDETLLRTASTLCRLDLLADTGSILCSEDLDIIDEEKDETGKRLRDSLISVINKGTKDLPVLDIRVNKGFGFRIGGVKHSEDRLFLGHGAGEYVEIFYSYLMPHRRWMRSWMALEMETAVGMDYGGGSLFRSGLTGLQLLLEFRLVITSLKYSDLPITVAFGGGGGLGGISMKYRANEAPYAGPNNIDDAASRGLAVSSVRLEFPITKWLRLQMLSRWVFQLGSPISRFEAVPFDASVKRPVWGKLDCRHIVVGFKVVFR